jgi:hypothetical protein
MIQAHIFARSVIKRRVIKMLEECIPCLGRCEDVKSCEVKIAKTSSHLFTTSQLPKRYPPPLLDWINILLKEDPNLLGQEYPDQKWLPLSQLKNPIRRSLCSNEYVFDIDAKDWNSCYKLARNLEVVLNEWEIPFLRFTSGNWLHYHVFFDKRASISLQIVKDYLKPLFPLPIEKANEMLYKFFKEMRFCVFKFLADCVKPVENTSFDLGVMKAVRHLIRMEGSMHEETGFYKSLLLELPKEQPKIRKEEVILPEKIEYWQIPEELIYYVYDRYVKKEWKESLKKLRPKISITKSDEISWIEKILENTFHDGRKRLLDLVILPYLITIKGLDPESAFNKAFNWVLKNHNVEPIRINKRTASISSLKNYICYRIRRIEKIGLMPLSKDNLEKWFADCEEILKIIGKGG